MRISAEPRKVEAQNFPPAYPTRQLHANTGMRYFFKTPALVYFNLDIIHPSLHASDLTFQGTSPSAFWERGSPDLPACGPQRGSTSGPVRPIFITQGSRPSRGAKPREADDARPPPERPSQAGSRGVEISRRGKPHEALVT